MPSCRFPRVGSDRDDGRRQRTHSERTRRWGRRRPLRRRSTAPRRAQGAGGEHRIEAVHSGKALDVDGASTDDGANVLQWGWHGGDNQRWRIEALDDGTHRIENVASGKVLDVSGPSADDGANVHQWGWHGGTNQRWRIEPVYEPA